MHIHEHDVVVGRSLKFDNTQRRILPLNTILALRIPIDLRGTFARRTDLDTFPPIGPVQVTILEHRCVGSGACRIFCHRHLARLLQAQFNMVQRIDDIPIYKKL